MRKLRSCLVSALSTLAAAFKNAGAASKALAGVLPRITGRRAFTLPLYALDGAEYISTRTGIKRRTPKRDKSISGRQWRKFRRNVGRYNAQMYLKALAARTAVHK